jgi:UDP-N-acetylglucosamine 2-epimerase (non-hydrolysing)
MIKVMTVFGTRPEAIKMAVLCKLLNDHPQIDHKICVTGQHKEMLDQVLDFFELTPHFDLAIMEEGQDLTDVTNRVLTGMRDIFLEYTPDLLLVHGDTTTSMSASLAAFYAGIKVGHVEAGLRTGDIWSPFPEEANRNITGKLATYHFAPTITNKVNLERENIHQNILITGNTVIDALFYTSNKVQELSENVYETHIRELFHGDNKILLVTGHRRENFGEGFIEICEALKDLAQIYPNLELVYPVHLNPKVQTPVNSILSGLKNVHLIKPLDYADFIFAMKKAWVILTDSGGVQEEAPSLGKPVLVMRDTTERPEAVDAGTVRLVGADKNNIIINIQKLMDNPNHYEEMSQANNPYGDGKAAERIVKFIEENFA